MADGARAEAEKLLAELDRIAAFAGRSVYGLPLHGGHLDRMVAAVLRGAAAIALAERAAGERAGAESEGG